MYRQYILVDRIAVPCENARVWGEFFEKHRPCVRSGTNVQVSTVFLAIDHNWTDSRTPILWETMVFNGPHDQYAERCSTWDEAVRQHVAVCKKVGVVP